MLEHEFVVPSIDFFGDINSANTSDGWRNDDFPRICAYVSSVGLLAELVNTGQSVAYVPEYIAERFGFRRLTTGCPYVCRQKIYRVCRRTKAPHLGCARSTRADARDLRCNPLANTRQCRSRRKPLATKYVRGFTVF